MTSILGDDMRLLGLMCVRNEADAYLKRTLNWHAKFLDMFVFDDQSTDNSVEVAEASGATVRVRRDNQPTFMLHEGGFRQAAWDSFQETMKPQFGDWVLAVDADEFYVTSEGMVPEAEMLQHMADVAIRSSCSAHVLRIVEMFDVIDGVPYQRVDGFWGQITGPRFFRYQPGGSYSDREMACGSAPTYIHVLIGAHTSQILHYGYVTEQQRRDKYIRYTERPNNGHNPFHVRSIVQLGDLRRWEGKIPA